MIVRVATIIHTSPVTGMTVDITSIAKSHSGKSHPNVSSLLMASSTHRMAEIDVTAADVDAYVISPYKVFSRHGYGVAWGFQSYGLRSRTTSLPERPDKVWELGTPVMWGVTLRSQMW